MIHTIDLAAGDEVVVTSDAAHGQLRIAADGDGFRADGDLVEADPDLIPRPGDEPEKVVVKIELRAEADRISDVDDERLAEFAARELMAMTGRGVTETSSTVVYE